MRRDWSWRALLHQSPWPLIRLARQDCSNQGALSSQKIARSGAIGGGSSSEPAGMISKSPLRALRGTCEPQTLQNATLKYDAVEREKEVTRRSPVRQRTAPDSTKRLAALEEPVAFRQRLQWQV